MKLTPVQTLSARALLSFLFYTVGVSVSSALSPDAALLSLILPGSQIVAGMHAQSHDRQPASFLLITHANSVDLEDFLSITGSDAFRVIHQVIFTTSAGHDGNPPEHSLLVSGNFDQARIFRSTSADSLTSQYRGIAVVLVLPLERERVAQSVVHIECSRQPYKVILESGLKFATRTIVIATGAQYVRLPIENVDAFAGRGIYYNATHMEAQLCDSEEVVVIGGGNSAGQAAVFLAQTSARVHLLVRSYRLSDSMSQYLVGRIEAHPRIDIHYLSQIARLSGVAHLEEVEWRDSTKGMSVTVPIRHVFVMAGATPRTNWLEDSLVLDKKGFIVTGPELAHYRDYRWPLERTPMLLETSVPGIFAVGDARAGSVKRVASAVGEGSMAVHLVHRYLAERRQSEDIEPVKSSTLV